MAAAVPQAPVIFQCGRCHRVLTDSNQILTAVAELGIVVFDAVIGVHVGERDAAEEDMALPLHCSACDHCIGRIYQQPPLPTLANLVHSDEAPRYALLQDALASYEFGSSAGFLAAPSKEAADTEAASNGSMQLDTAGRLDVLERGNADSQTQLTQLMRVVLALNQRLHTLEEANSHGDEADGGAGSEAGEREAVSFPPKKAAGGAGAARKRPKS